MSSERPKFTAEAIARACRGALAAGSPQGAANSVSTDSRAMRGDEVFFALRGPRHDGHSYVTQAVAGGASIVVVERGRTPPPGTLGPTSVVEVEDTAAALLQLAGWHRTRLKGRVIAVTGSCGKSTVKGMLSAILSRCGTCTGAPASYNNRVGVSLTLLAAQPDDQYVVLELGTNAPGEIDELARHARPDASLITCIGDTHLEALGSREGVKEAKSEIIPHTSSEGILMLNADDTLCLSLGERFEGAVRTFGFSSGADARGTGLRCRDGVWTFQVADRPGVDFRLNMLGRINVLNALAALLAARWAGAPADAARSALAEFRPPKLRFEREQIGGVTFIKDCYNSNPTALRVALEAFLQEPDRGRKVVICGDMLELGERAPQLHRHAGRVLAGVGIPLLAAVGPLGRFMLEGWRELATGNMRALHFESAEDAWRPLCALLRPGDLVLLKGSRGMKLETITERLADHMVHAAVARRQEAA